MEKQFIDIAYDLARTKYNKKAFTFEQLWTDLVKKAKLDEDEQKHAGEVYTAMLQDTRFIFCGKGQWKLREFLTLEEQAQLSNALYDFSTEAEEEGDEAESAKRAKRTKVEEEDTYYGEEDESRDEMYDEAKQQALDDTDETDDDEDEESEPEDDEEEEK